MAVYAPANDWGLSAPLAAQLRQWMDYLAPLPDAKYGGYDDPRIIWPGLDNVDPNTVYCQLLEPEPGLWGNESNAKPVVPPLEHRRPPGAVKAKCLELIRECESGDMTAAELVSALRTAAPELCADERSVTNALYDLKARHELIKVRVSRSRYFAYKLPDGQPDH